MRQIFRSGGFRRRLGSLGQKRLWTAGLLIASGVMVLSFQNCSQPMTGDGTDPLASEASKLDFAYDATVDQIAYMSCSNSAVGTYDSSAYFTLRVGAYRNGGLKLNESFRAAMGKKPLDRQSSLLEASPANTNTSIQIALRANNNYQNILTSSGSARLNEDFANFLEPLGTPPMCGELIQADPSVRIRYLRNGRVDGARMEGSLHFSNSFTLADSVRQFLRNDGLLALTYTHTRTNTMGAAETLARSPADVFEGASANPARSVYGRGFQLRFGQPSVPSLYSQFPTTVLTEVTEQNMLDPADRTGVGSWACPSSLQFRIVRYEDIARNVAGVNCVAGPDPKTFSSSSDQELFKMARNSLRPEDWYIDWARKCIVPKKPGNACYGKLTTIKYTMSETCNTNSDPTCVAYTSICYRTGTN